ncbi:MAG: RNA polymerase sigma factor [Leptonema sp. (in: bacteria)]
MEFDLIYKRYYKILFDYVYKFTYDSFHTNDILQESFIKFWEKYNNQNLENKEFFVLKKICKNTAIDFLRNKKENFYFLSSKEIQSIKNIDSYEYLFNELLEKINRIASTLPNEDLRQLYFLLLESKKNQREIAKIMNISERHLRRKIKQLFNKIKEKIEESI